MHGAFSQRNTVEPQNVMMWMLFQPSVLQNHLERFKEILNIKTLPPSEGSGGAPAFCCFSAVGNCVNVISPPREYSGSFLFMDSVFVSSSTR